MRTLQTLWYGLIATTRIYMHLSIVLFVAFALVIVIQYIKNQAAIVWASSIDTDVDNLLSKLNSHLSMTCQAVCQLANYFSIIFLFAITCIFVQTVTYSDLTILILAGTVQRNNYFTALNTGYIFRMIFLLNAICYMADKIKNEVHSKISIAISEKNLKNNHHSEIIM